MEDEQISNAGTMLDLTMDPEFSCTTTSCGQQWLYRFGERGIIYSQKQNRIAGLDAAGLLAYRAFDAGASLHDLEALDSPMPADSLQAIFSLSKGQFPQAREPEEPRVWPRLRSQARANVQVHGIPMLVEYTHGDAEKLCKDCFLSSPCTDQPARFHLRIRREADSWKITVNGKAIVPQVKDRQAGLGLLHAVRSLLYDEAEYDIAFHAAMVANSQHGILLCAPREAGKSTLSAYLAARGFLLVTDEPALLHLDTSSVSSVGMPVSLKEGAWKLLEKEWPQLAGAPVHVRSDGRRIKLLHTSRDRTASMRQKLTHILFPKYAPSASPRLEPLASVRTLALLSDGGMLFGKQFDKDKFEQFLRWICITPAFVVQYSSLREADAMIQKVLAYPLTRANEPADR